MEESNNEIKKIENSYTDKQIELIRSMYSKNTTKEEFELFMYIAGKYQLDPLVKQIWCVQFEKKENGKVVGYEKPQIYAGRDGFLEIAHRSGVFNGMKSGMKSPTTAYAEIYRKDMQFPFYVEVDLSEYSTGQSLWRSKPHTMLVKVAESQALRKAFSITGIYSPEEMSQWELDTQGIEYKASTITTDTIMPSTASQSHANESKAQTGTFDWSKVKLDKKVEFKASVDKDGKVRVDKKGNQIPYNGIWYHTMKEVRDALPTITGHDKLVKEFIGKASFKDFTYGDLKTVQEFIPAWVEKFATKSEDNTIEVEVTDESIDNKMKETFNVEPEPDEDFEQATFNNEEIPE